MSLGGLHEGRTVSRQLIVTELQFQTNVGDPDM
jgi:hypothetical protein